MNTDGNNITDLLFDIKNTDNLKLSYQQLEKAIVLLPDDVNDILCHFNSEAFLYTEDCKTGCFNCDSFQCAINLINECSPNNIAILNLANPFRPISKIRIGRCTQEEDLCNRSTLLCSLYSKNATKYYHYNQNCNDPNQSTAMLISPSVEIIKDKEGNHLSKSHVVSIITCAAPITNNTERNKAEYKSLVYHRIVSMLTCIAYYKYNYLVLGAWGCGAFGNDAETISSLFKKAIFEDKINGVELSKCFKRVDFAVLDKSIELFNYKCFKRCFGD